MLRDCVGVGEAGDGWLWAVRGLVPKEFLRQECETKSFTVSADDTIEPAVECRVKSHRAALGVSRRRRRRIGCQQR